MRSDFYFKHLLAYNSGAITAVGSHDPEVSVTTVPCNKNVLISAVLLSSIFRTGTRLLDSVGYHNYNT